MPSQPQQSFRWEAVALVAVTSGIWFSLFPLVLPLVKDFIAVTMAMIAAMPPHEMRAVFDGKLPDTGYQSILLPMLVPMIRLFVWLMAATCTAYLIRLANNAIHILLDVFFPDTAR